MRMRADTANAPVVNATDKTMDMLRFASAGMRNAMLSCARMKKTVAGMASIIPSTKLSILGAELASTSVPIQEGAHAIFS